MLDFFRTHRETYRRNVMLTYGGDLVTQGMIALASRRRIPVVFAIHNFAYTELPVLPRMPRAGVPAIAQFRRLGPRADGSPRAQVRDVRQSAAGEAPAGHPAAGRRAPRQGVTLLGRVGLDSLVEACLEFLPPDGRERGDGQDMPQGIIWRDGRGSIQAST